MWLAARLTPLLMLPVSFAQMDGLARGRGAFEWTMDLV